MRLFAGMKPHASGLLRVRISKPVRAVKLQAHPGSTLRNPTETLIEIPADVVVILESAAAPSGLCNIIWGNDAYSVLYDELTENGHFLNAIETLHNHFNPFGR